MSPLMRRLPREFVHNIGRYLGIFVLMTVAIGATTGFLVAAANIQRIAGETRDTYNVEDFRFATSEPASQDALDAVEDLGAAVYRNFSVDVDATVPGADADGSSRKVELRAYEHRGEVDRAAYDEGRAPAADDEISVDRTFADHANVSVGGKIEIGGHAYTVSGIMTLPDYQSLFQKNSDFVMDTLTFTVAEVTKGGYEALAETSGAKEAHTYSVVLDDRGLDRADRIDAESDAAKELAAHGVDLTELLDCDANKGISYAREDTEGDSAMWYVMLIMIIAIMGFVFAVLTGSTIDAESAVIGTLLASGYRKRELICHYLLLPALVGVLGAAIGNIVGYTLLSGPMKDLYYNSYSFPPYVAEFQPGVLLRTTVPPLVLLIGTTLVGLCLRLRATPLQFLRSERPGRVHVRHVGLPDALPFSSRFRLRVVLRNVPHFVVLFFGIAFASLLLMFGMCMMPVIEQYAQTSRESLVAKHQYTLKASVPLDPGVSQSAEAFCAGSLELPRAMGDDNETLPVYGIEVGSRFWRDMDVSGGRVLLGAGAARKCGVSAGQGALFHDSYTDEDHYLTVSAVVGEPTDMNVYMSRDTFNGLFGRDAGYFNGYVSNAELNLPDGAVASDLTPDAMGKIVDQMRDSMGDMVDFLLGVAVLIYLVIVYLLTKTVIERSARAIAYLKVFGYRNTEVDRLYLLPITAVVLVSLVACIPPLLALLDQVMFWAFMDMDGIFPLTVPAWCLAAEVGVGVAVYALVALLHVRRIRRVPMAEALKVTE